MCCGISIPYYFLKRVTVYQDLSFSKMNNAKFVSMRFKTLNQIALLSFVFLSFSISSCKKTCSDGKKNQKEEGIDCGGPCRPCSDCTDGIQSGRETGVDCGGDCTPCRTLYPFGSIESGTNENLIEVDCDGPNCAAIGEDGAVLVSQNSGETWTLKNANTTSKLKGVQIIQNTIYVCGEDGLIKKSTDLGGSFSDIPESSINYTINDILFFDQDTGLICGDKLTIFFTHDGGETWNRGRRSSTAQRTLYAMSSPEKNIVYTIGENAVYLSVNNGVTWEAIGLSTENPELTGFTDLYYYSNSRAFVTGENSVLFSVNSVEWFNRAVYTKNGGISFLNEVGLVAGRDDDNNLGKVIESIDSGMTWTQIPIADESVRFNDCFIIDESNSIIVGDKGTILRR